MYCYLCGQKIDDSAETCPYCGAKVKKVEPVESTAQKPVQPAEKDEFFDPPPAPPAATQQTSVQTQQSASTPTQSNGFALGGFICAFFFPLIGLILSIIGLVRCSKGYDRKGLAIAGIIISAVSIIISIIYTAVIYPILMEMLEDILNTMY